MSATSNELGLALNFWVVSAEEVDEYLRGVGEPKRSVLETLRRTELLDSGGSHAA